MPNTQNSPTPNSRLNETPSNLNASNLKPRSNRLRTALQAILVCFIAVTMLGASDPSTRFDRLGHQLMCTCGCGEILLECNHVGCPVSAPMITELHNQIAGGGQNRGILDWFAAKYGPIVLAAPIRGGFDLVAWIMPFAVLALGIAAVFYFMRLWKGKHLQAALSGTAGLPNFPAAHTDGMRDRIRRETTFEP